MIRPISKPPRHRDPEPENDHTVWWCDICDERGVDPADHDACIRPKGAKS